MERFVGKVAIVTGAGNGIGRETAGRFAFEGAKIAAVDVDEVGLAETMAMIRGRGGECIAIPTDVSRSSEVERMVKIVVESYRTVDILFNNAGITKFSPLCETDEETFDTIMGINAKGVWLGMKYAIPEMIKGGGGCVVNTCSTGSTVAVRNYSAYCASKHAVAGLTKCASIEYGRMGIRVNGVAPGATYTPMQAKHIAHLSKEELNTRLSVGYPSTGRLGEAREVAGAVLFLCSEDASNVHGTVLSVDGGYTAQ